MLTSLVSLFLACSSFLILELVNFRSSMTREMTGIADIIAINSLAPLEFQDRISGQETLNALRASPEIFAAAIYTEDGKIFAAYMRSDLKDPKLSKTLHTPKKDGDYLKDGHLALFRPIFRDNKRVGTVYLESDLSAVTTTLKRYGIISFLVLLFSSLVAFILSAKLQKKISQPILDLAKTSQEICEGKNYSVRATKQSNDEIGYLTDRFNEMLTQVQDRDNELQHAYNALEERVQERTQELQYEVNIRRETEIKLIHAKEEAEKSSNAKSEFMSRMSHELRTPMNAILGFGQLLEYDEEEPLTEAQRLRLKEILNAGDHLLELINEVLDLSRIESGELSISVESFDTVDIVISVIALVQPLAQERGIKIINQVPAEPPVVVKADQTRIKQVILNLLSNAIKYNRENGTVTIASEILNDGRVRISVTDTGFGIPKDRQEELFEPFNRLDADETNIEGTGIGLTVSKRLLQMIGGSIELESELGEGSCFSIYIPEGELPEFEEIKIPIQPLSKTLEIQNHSEHTILYVEDNLENLKLAQEILKQKPQIKLISAPEANTGIELAREHKPNLILMDINLPGLSGVEAFKQLKTYEETQFIPVIAVSANAMQSDIDRAMSIGFHSYITKPIQVIDFLDKISSCLNSIDINESI